MWEFMFGFLAARWLGTMSSYTTTTTIGSTTGSTTHTTTTRTTRSYDHSEGRWIE